MQNEQLSSLLSLANELEERQRSLEQQLSQKEDEITKVRMFTDTVKLVSVTNALFSFLGAKVDNLLLDFPQSVVSLRLETNLQTEFYFCV